ncbi:MAG: hypothetical protein F6K41_13815 [Symploca sp. SIO3E6]|nr:hypothetical protein [Caldora sp. SIO3E6]
MSLTPETAPSHQVIEAFCELLSPARYVFSQKDAPALYELIDNLPSEQEAIAEQLLNWCQQRRKVFNSLKSILSKRGPNESTPPPKPEDYKTHIKNKMRENYPEPTQNTNTSQQQSNSNQ